MAEYIYGRSVIKSALDNNKEISKLYIQTDRNDDLIEVIAKKKRICVEHLNRKQMDQLVAGNHQGYIALVPDYKYYSIEEIVSSIPKGKQPLLLAFDSLNDPHNLGAALRSLACVGGDGVIIEKNRSVSLTGTVAKVSCGAIDLVKVAQVTNLNQTLNYLKEQGYWVVGADIRDAVDYRSVKYDMPIVLVVGSEGSGLRPLVSKNCDIKVKLPMEFGFDSLNASVASGILLYEIYNQRFPLD